MKTKFQRIHEINGLDRRARPNLANIPATSLVPWHLVRSGFVAVGLALGSVNAAFAQPVIANQPVSQTNVVGSSATLCVEATGTPPLFYQWRRGAGNLPAETNACLVFTNLQTANAGNYIVVVTNSEGSVTSATAFVRVVMRPVITQQPTPTNQSVSLGAIVSFTVAASSQFSFTNYQWRLNGADLPGRTNATLVLSNVQASDPGDYTAVVSNLAGAVTSRVARLEVDATFTKITTGRIVTDIATSSGLTWGDYDNDGFLDLFVPNMIRSPSPNGNDFLYRNNGDGPFSAVTNTIIVTDALNSEVGVWGDYDNDGYLDLFVTHGQNVQSSFLFRNNGDGTFTRVTNGSPANTPGEYDGACWGDFDNDGFVDLFVTNAAGAQGPRLANFLYRNNGNSNSWLTVKLAGTVSNRSAIGAKVRVKAFFAGAVRWQLRQISGGDGYGGQNGLRANFGLGDATNTDLVRIEWPSGTVQELTNVAVKQFLTVTEPPRLQAAMADGQLQLTLTAWPGQRFVIDTSTNLADWTPFATVTNDSRTAVLTDVLDSPQRFYRAGAF
jgi:hypothetical protein